MTHFEMEGWIQPIIGNWLELASLSLPFTSIFCGAQTRKPRYLQRANFLLAPSS